MADEKIIKRGPNTQQEIINGVVEAVDAIKTTLGPSGKCVAISDPFGNPNITRDGVSVSRSISFKDPLKNMGAVLIKNAASKTEESSGDGPQPLNAKILTPNGWITMGSIKVGDIICGTNRTKQEVTGVYPKGKKTLYKVILEDNREVSCCEDHLWTVKSGDTVTTLPLKTIIETGSFQGGKGEKEYLIPRTRVEFSKKELPIDPFLFGIIINNIECIKNNTGIKLQINEEFDSNKIRKRIINAKVPENIRINVSKVYSQQDGPDYLFIKFEQVDINKESIQTVVKNLINSSNGRYIPESYIYSSEVDRISLIRGIITKGYTESESSCEFITSNTKLVNDIKEVISGLGVKFKEEVDDNFNLIRLHIFKELVDSWIKIVRVKKTNKNVEMQCIKVSNPDELYITNDYVVTHNTSTCSILTKEMVLRGQKALNTGSNVNEIKSGMIKAEKWILDYITKNSISIEGDLEKIRRVATISANNDPEIGDLIVECMQKIGIDGIITAEFSNGLDTLVDVTKGMVYNRGWSSPQFVTSPAEGKCIMENPYIIIVGEKISSVNQILPLMNQLMNTGRPFLFVVDDMDAVVETTLIMNCLNGAIRTCVVKGIDFGDSRKASMADIAVFTGGTFITPENGIDITQATLEDLGSASKVVISRDTCIIYEGNGDPADIAGRVNILKQRLSDPTCSDYDKNKFTKRIANLSGGIGIIRAGGISEVEKTNKKATIEDAILASKSAIEEGCCCGGGYVYYKSSIDIKKDKNFWKDLTEEEKEGALVVINSLPVIMKTVAENAGVSGDIILDKVKSSKPGIGFNAKTRKFSDLLKDGVLDSTKVLKSALENAVSTASMILLIDCTVTEEVKDIEVKE